MYISSTSTFRFALKGPESTSAPDASDPLCIARLRRSSTSRLTGLERWPCRSSPSPAPENPSSRMGSRARLRRRSDGRTDHG
eukprot:scaffold213217_cov27-Tisochrysis_lutea.AAC.4